MSLSNSTGPAAVFSLNRTSNPTYTHYMSDGLGRDTYILKHNGGLCREREPNHHETSRFGSPCRYIAPAPKRDATAIKYSSDGSGRDSYILYNSGGNCSLNTGGTYQGFQKQLRRDSFVKRVLPPQSVISHKRDFHYWQQWQHPLLQQHSKRASSRQRQLYDRLATPKEGSRNASKSRIEDIKDNSAIELGVQKHRRCRSMIKQNYATQDQSMQEASQYLKALNQRQHDTSRNDQIHQEANTPQRPATAKLHKKAMSLFRRHMINTSFKESKEVSSERQGNPSINDFLQGQKSILNTLKQMHKQRKGIMSQQLSKRE